MSRVGSGELGRLSENGDEVDSESAAFIEWTRNYACPTLTTASHNYSEEFSRLGAMIGDASVVAFGEAVHGGAEPLEFRNRLIQYLIEEKGFTTIAIESGVVEGRVVHEYVRGRSGCLDTVLSEGLSWSFDLLPQNHALVRWLRHYNSTLRYPRPVSFYGFDLPGSAGNSRVNRGLRTALEDLLDYIVRVDRGAAGAFRARVGALLDKVRFDFHGVAGRSGYESLSGTDRDALTAAIADLAGLLECRKAQYLSASTPDDYEWACRSAVGARQVDMWLRQIPLDWAPSDAPLVFPSEQTRFLSAANDLRTRAQADNIDWILRKEGSSAKMLIFAHRYHLSAASVKASWTGGIEQWVLGTHLRHQLGDRLLTIGNVIGRGTVECDGLQVSIADPVPGWIESAATQVGLAEFLLDLREAPDRVKRWLAREHTFGHSLSGANRHTLQLVPGEAYDVIWYLGETRPAGRATHTSDISEEFLRPADFTPVR